MGVLVAITTFAVLAVVAASVAAQAPAPAQRTTGSLPVQITGAAFVEYDEAMGIWRVEGAPVTVTRGQTVVRAPRGRFDERARIVTVEGGVEVVEPGLTLRADAAELRLSDERIRARGNVRLVSTRDGQPATLVAPEAEGSLATRRFAATGGVSVTRGEWTATGRRVDYDDTDQVAVISGDPEVRFKDAVMTADTVTVWVAREEARGDGTVRLRRGELTGSGRRVEMRLRDQRATLSGAARVERGRDRLEAEEIEVELDRSRATARGAPRLTITPP